MENSEQLGSSAEDSNTGLCLQLAGPSPARAGAMWAADQGCLDTAGPWLEPSPASDTSCCQQRVSGSQLLRRGDTAGPAQRPPPQPAGAHGPAASPGQPALVYSSGDDGRSWQGAGAAGLGTEGIPGDAAVRTHRHVPHLTSCHWASSLSGPCLCTPPRLSPHPAPRCLPWTAAGPSGWASSPQTPPRSMPGPRCAGSSPHLSPCREETRYKGSFFHSTLQQKPPCSTSSSPEPNLCPHIPGDALRRRSCPVWGSSTQASRRPRPVTWVDVGPAAALAPTSTAGSGGERPSRHPPRELTRKSWFC